MLIARIKNNMLRKVKSARFRDASFNVMHDPLAFMSTKCGVTDLINYNITEKSK